MEIRRNSSRTVYLDIYGDNADATPTAEIKVNGTTTPALVESETAPTGVTERWFVNIGMAHTQSDGPLTLSWAFEIDGQPVAKNDYFTVVTPYLTISEVKRIVPLASTEDAQRLESSVRHIINAHCGQSFGLYEGDYTVRGNGNRLNLPARLISLTSVNGFASQPEDPISNYYSIEGGGWALSYLPWGVPPVKADYYGLHMHVGGVIHNPNMVKIGDFNKNRVYTITGKWGYEGIPEPVQEAARLLVDNYSSTDSEYRDRYLTSMTAADWRIQFNASAFVKTGNVRADQLLAPFVLKAPWVVI